MPTLACHRPGELKTGRLDVTIPIPRTGMNDEANFPKSRTPLAVETAQTLNPVIAYFIVAAFPAPTHRSVSFSRAASCVRGSSAAVEASAGGVVASLLLVKQTSSGLRVVSELPGPCRFQSSGFGLVASSVR